MLVELPIGNGAGTRSREHLLNCAIALFAQSGIEQVSVRAVCERAGWSYATFFTLFAGKSELVEEVTHMLGVELRTRWREEADRLADVGLAAAFGPQWTLQKVSEDPHLGLLIAQALEQDGIAQNSAAHDLHDYFDVAPEGYNASPTYSDDLVRMINASTAAAIRLVLAGHPLVPVQKLTSETVLRMLGFEAPVARELVQTAHGLLPQPRHR